MYAEFIAYPYPDFKWGRVTSQSEQDVPEDGVGIVNTESSSKLTIQSVSQSLFGVYRLTASNTQGELSVNFEVTARGEYIAHIRLSNLIINYTKKER